MPPLTLGRSVGKIWHGSQAAGSKAAQHRGNTFYRIAAAELDNWVKASAGLYADRVAETYKGVLHFPAWAALRVLLFLLLLLLLFFPLLSLGLVRWLFWAPVQAAHCACSTPPCGLRNRP